MQRSLPRLSVRSSRCDLNLVINAARFIRGAVIDEQAIDFIATPNGDYNPQTSIFIKSLPEGITEQELISLFSKFGLVLATMVNPTYPIS